MNDSDFSPMMFKFCLKLKFSRMFADVLDDAELQCNTLIAFGREIYRFSTNLDFSKL